MDGSNIETFLFEATPASKIEDLTWALAIGIS